MYSSFYLYIFPRVECRANSQNGRIWGWPAGSDSKRLHLPPCTNYCMSPNLHLLFLTTCNVFKVSSKYVFVRILRNSVHLQRDTFVHWGCWLGSVTTIVALAFVVAEVIPIFSYVLSLVGSVCYAPLAIMLPGWLWLHDHGHYLRGPSHRIVVYSLHWLMLPLGGLFLVGATYGVVLQIKEAYANGDIGMWISSPFSLCKGLLHNVSV